VHSLNT